MTLTPPDNSMHAEKFGQLFVVATPIGNLQDITQRALQVLESVDWIAAEDTRHSKKLCQHFGINTRLISLHDFNEQERSQQLLAKLQAGESGALISDAGTPLISDPGYHLVSLLRDSGVRVTPVPGPSAMITALCAAGMPTDRFSFEGFLPAKAPKRLAVLQSLVHEPRTLVFYESTHRLMDSLAAMASAFGEARLVTVAKELTKQFERFVSGTFAEVIVQFEENVDWQRGEFVVMVAGDSKDADEIIEFDNLAKICLAQGLPVKQISEIVADFYQIKKKVVYQRLLELKETDA
ncbi:16S rRNA (cytidine(1402)-2'-O)-methyltransferase [Thiosulfativibrio zosterae]|uniref:Ribosomal RNA small subunit methyltransferase I n=1 Tax=Thiosulfativibrio zosterae TaxID=2675053 RepID=A0A6F8PL18_9GAMM|nr:16S rRNA (cytidine(1402)-2'-O)-methyltransferase [Thiosulfativibrio zosterae]BBP42768.1 ribosomal RNA small subunit methyltransferase I [Thiosulfativibrio zosterae]